MHSNLSRYCVWGTRAQGQLSCRSAAPDCQRRRLWNGQGGVLALNDLSLEGGALRGRLMENSFECLLCIRHCVRHLASLPQHNSRSQSYESLKGFCRCPEQEPLKQVLWIGVISTGWIGESNRGTEGILAKVQIRAVLQNVEVTVCSADPASWEVRQSQYLPVSSLSLVPPTNTFS